MSTTWLRDYLREKRPNLSESSLITYTSILSTLYKRVFGDSDENPDPKKFEYYEKVLQYLHTMPPPTRKTVLSALIVATGGNEEYRKQMLEDINSYNKQIKTQEKTPQQKESWVDSSHIRAVWEDLQSKANRLYKLPDKTPADLQQIQQFVLLTVLGGIFMAPRRSLDWTAFKANDVDSAKDNYLDKKRKELVFNRYKTAKVYHQQRVACPPEVLKILNRWIKLRPTREYLFFDIAGNPLSSVKVNQRFVKMFGKNAGVNQMRHTYLTDKYGHTLEENKKIAQTMEEMGSSPAQLTLYVKKTD
jgi:integrase